MPTIKPEKDESKDSWENDAIENLHKIRTKKLLKLALERYEGFIESGKNPEDFWNGKKVTMKIAMLRGRIESFEESACNDFFNELPEELYSTADTLGVTPEMICQYIGQTVLEKRRLRKGKY